MYSSEDLERFYFQYKTEALPHGVSIQEFCVRNKVPYNIFSKWFKDTRKQIVEVTVDGRPSEEKKPLPFRLIPGSSILPVLRFAYLWKSE